MESQYQTLAVDILMLQLFARAGIFTYGEWKLRKAWSRRLYSIPKILLCYSYLT